MEDNYNVVVVCTINEIQNIDEYIIFFEKYLNPKHIIIVADKAVKEVIDSKNMRVSYIEENSIYPGMTLEAIRKIISDMTGNKEDAVNRAGWYFQQFIKMAYAYRCEDENYLVWDADTIPIHAVSMYSQERKKVFDVRTEYCKAYFRTLNRLFPELKKENNYSFISEHMIIDTVIMKELIEKIESNRLLSGNSFWKKILNAIEMDDIAGSGFSEFETYGTYVEKYYPSVYSVRRWKSLREGTIFYKDGISVKTMEYLAREFDAVSFEKHPMHLKLQKFMGHKIFQKTAIMVLYQKVAELIKS